MKISQDVETVEHHQDRARQARALAAAASSPTIRALHEQLADLHLAAAAALARPRQAVAAE